MNDENIIDVDYTDTELESEISGKVINGEPLFYTTAQASEMVGVEPSTIRFWTKRFDSLLDIEVSNKHRRYKKSDIAKFKFIKKLAYDDGLTLQQIEDYCSSKGFDINDIENGIIDANNPIAIQAFVSAMTVEIDKKLNNFSEQLLDKFNDSLKNYLLMQAEMNDKLQEHIVTTVDEVVTEKLDSKLESFKSYVDQRELEAKQREDELFAMVKASMEDRKKLAEELQKEKSKGLFRKLFSR